MYLLLAPAVEVGDRGRGIEDPVMLKWRADPSRDASSTDMRATYLGTPVDLQVSLNSGTDNLSGVGTVRSPALPHRVHDGHWQRCDVFEKDKRHDADRAVSVLATISSAASAEYCGCWGASSSSSRWS